MRGIEERDTDEGEEEEEEEEDTGALVFLARVKMTATTTNATTRMLTTTAITAIMVAERAAVASAIGGPLIIVVVVVLTADEVRTTPTPMTPRAGLFFIASSAVRFERRIVIAERAAGCSEDVFPKEFATCWPAVLTSAPSARGFARGALPSLIALPWMAEV